MTNYEGCKMKHLLALPVSIFFVSTAGAQSLPGGAAAPVSAPAAAASAPQQGYSLCAAEHVACVPLAASHVIYGAGAKFTAPIPATSAFICDNTKFKDPSPGVVKSCWIKLDQVLVSTVVQGHWLLSDATGKILNSLSADLPACTASALQMSSAPTTLTCASSASVTLSWLNPEIPITPITIPIPGVMSMHGGLDIDPRVILPSNPGVSVARIGQNATTTPVSDIGAFRTECGPVKMAFDDPIVYPGQAGKSHLHTYFGNTGVNANSTSESLRDTGDSTCSGGIVNRTAYWVPTMIDMATGLAMYPRGLSVYYKTGYFLDFASGSNIKPMPAGLKMISGNPTATSAATSYAVRYMCSGGPNSENDKYGVSIPDCDAGADMIMQVDFPQCWDGVNFDSPNHQSHMAYPSNGKCPADHPVALPLVSYNVPYLTPPNHAILKWRLSSDGYDTKLPGGFTGHGDWYNGWREDISDAWGNNCVKARRDCHSDLLGDGRSLLN